MKLLKNAPESAAAVPIGAAPVNAIRAYATRYFSTHPPITQ